MVLSPMDQCMEIDAQGHEYCSNLGVVCFGLDFWFVFLLCCGVRALILLWILGMEG